MIHSRVVKHSFLNLSPSRVIKSFFGKINIINVFVKVSKNILKFEENLF